jgi:hypothetical protein
VNRRRFLSSIAYPAAGALGVLDGRPVYVRPATAWIVAAVQIAAAFASIVSKFAERSDGGLSALLTSIRNLQLETINLLVQIRQSLAEISIEIRRLPGQIDGLLDAKFLQQYEAELFGAFREFQECVAARSSTRQLTDTEIETLKLKQRRLRDRIVEARQTLQSFNSIAGLPHSALLSVFIYFAN